MPCMMRARCSNIRTYVPLPPSHLLSSAGWDEQRPGRTRNRAETCRIFLCTGCFYQETAPSP
jgi:hypothetical protein